MKNCPKITVIIPTFKRDQYLIRAVKNVLCQDYPNYEIIIIDDNGLGTINQIKTYNSIKNLINSHTNIRYICQENNSGVCCARNRGITEAKGEYIAFLDDDDYWHKTFLSETYSIIKDKNAAIVYSNFYRMNENGIYFNENEKFFTGKIRDYLLDGWCPATTSLFCIKRSVLVDYTGFDESLKNLEEYDLWIRLSKQYSFFFCDKKLVIKNESAHEQLTNNYSSRIQAWRKLKNLWYSRDLDENQKRRFFFIINQMINSDSYHLLLQNIKGTHHLSEGYKYGLGRVLFMYLVKFTGNSFANAFKNYILKINGTISYLPKTNNSSLNF